MALITITIEAQELGDLLEIVELAQYPAVNGGCWPDRLSMSGCFYAYVITRVKLDYRW